MVDVKICGIKDLQALNAAITYGARYVGFVFYPLSSRAVTLEQAQILTRHVPTGVKSVGLFVNPTDAELQQIIPSLQLDLIQLHGNESPRRTFDIKTRTSLKVMKAISVQKDVNMQHIEAYEVVSDWLLFDTKTTEHGGSGQSFDWLLLKGHEFKRPWMLAGGINTANIEEACALLSPSAIDISSGVESQKGVKDPKKIKEFLVKAKNL